MTKKQVSMVTIAMILGNVMAGLDSTISNTALPAIVADLHGIQFMGWIVALLLLGMSVSIPIWSKLGERFGNKITFELAILLFVLGSLFQGLAKDMYFFLLARTVMGIGAGGMGSIPYVMAGYIFPNIRKRTQILGYLGGSFSLAAILGPLVGGYLVDTFSWHWVFFVNIPIGLMAIILVAIFYQEKLAQTSNGFDAIGAILVVNGLISLLLGIQLIGMVPTWLVVTLSIMGLILLATFVKYEKTAASPIVPIAMFKNKALVGDLLLFVFSWGAFLAVNTYLPMWAQGLLGTTALVGGMTLIPNSLLDTVGTQVVNPMKARFKEYYLIAAAIGCMLISSLSLVFLPSDTSIWLLAFLTSFSGFGVGFVFVILQIKVQVDAGPEDMAPATSLSYLIRILAQTVMAAVYGVIMNLALARGVAQHPEITIGMLNKLSDATAAKSLPTKLLPTMRQIFHGGLREIMICASIMLLVTLLLNFKFNRKTLSE